MQLVAEGYGLPYLDEQGDQHFGHLILDIEVTFPDTIDLTLIPTLKEILPKEINS